jgi:hypothetical protein
MSMAEPRYHVAMLIGSVLIAAHARREKNQRNNEIVVAMAFKMIRLS